jgi:hypothetical protein
VTYDLWHKSSTILNPSKRFQSGFSFLDCVISQCVDVQNMSILYDASCGRCVVLRRCCRSLPINSPPLFSEEWKSPRLLPLPLFPALFNAATLEATPCQTPLRRRLLKLYRHFMTPSFHQVSGQVPSPPSSPRQVNTKPLFFTALKPLQRCAKHMWAKAARFGSTWKAGACSPLPKSSRECISSQFNSEHFSCFFVDSV